MRVRVLSREADLDGRETLGEAPDLFVVYPERMVVGPGGAQTVRVQWKGPADPARELCFRIVAEPGDVGGDDVDAGVGQAQQARGTLGDFGIGRMPLIEAINKRRRVT